ncbi:MAG: hypothetical protein Q4D66_04685 [Bacteroidales bacterium]|nr:hypothetical protein [Bacteroidales bacterium]
MHKVFLFFLLSLPLLGSLTACESEPVAPQDERLNKQHEDPTKAEFILTKGYLTTNKSPNALLFDKYPRRSQFVATAPPQVLTKVITKDIGWHLAPGSIEAFVVGNTLREPENVYRLDINYYNIDGELMNQQFIENGQEKIHQHFFSYYQNDVRINKPELLPFQYVYADEDKQGNYTAVSSPLGFTGFVRFTGPNGAYTLTVDLMHAIDSKYDKQGKVSPFYAPSAAQIGRALWDISTDLPFQVKS